ncbi:MAG: GTPase HflX [Clostridia bacterium]|nr:GTPase HflX [Clostridia bacterium]
MAKKIYENTIEQENAIVVVVCSKKGDNIERKTEEINRLSFSANLNVVENFYQIIKDFNKGTVIGKGKIEEIKKYINDCEEIIDVVIVDYPLSGSQMKNLSDEFGVKVLDRVGLIIDIFAAGAKSREARLQVKLAQDLYVLPRLSQMQGSSGRFGSAGVGMRGPGETKLELNRRILEKEMETLKTQIAKIKQQRQESRKERLKSDLPKIALVGYTNSGKTSLLNLLVRENIYADDKYFATLDTTTRKLFLGEGKYAIITDTVGFISDLPHQLVDAFSSTLEEATDADLLLHVVDCSLDKNVDGLKEYEVNMQVTNDLLDKLGATKNRLVVLNKADKLSKPQLIKENEVLISTKTKRGIEELLEKIKEKVI